MSIPKNSCLIASSAARATAQPSILERMPADIFNHTYLFLDRQPISNLSLISESRNEETSISPLSLSSKNINAATKEAAQNFFETRAGREPIKLADLKSCGGDFASEKEFCLDLSLQLISDSTLNNIVRKFPNITEIKAGGCLYVTDLGLQHLGRLSRLARLSLSGCNRITNLGISHLRNVPLEYPDLSRCSQVTPEAFEDLSHFPRLTRFIIPDPNLRNRHG